MHAHNLSTYFYALIVEVDGRPCGAAIYHWTYSTWAGRCLYLEDVFVEKPYRGRGIGSILFQLLARMGVEHNCGRFHWISLAHNATANAYYTNSLKAAHLDDVYSWSIERTGMEHLAKLLRFA